MSFFLHCGILVHKGNMVTVNSGFRDNARANVNALQMH